MLKLSLIGVFLIVVTVMIHAIGTTLWIRHLGQRYVQQDGRWSGQKWLTILSSTGLILVALHVVQIVLWAITYRVLVPTGELPTFETAVYFSFVTFTTLGFGDIVPKTQEAAWWIMAGS